MMSVERGLTSEDERPEKQVAEKQRNKDLESVSASVARLRILAIVCHVELD